MNQGTAAPFPQVTGHEEIRRHLMGALTSGKLSHAYLLEGMEGVGRRTMTMAFIQALLCAENGGRKEGCGRCVSCRTIMDGNHPDVRRICVPKGEGTIRVRQIREELVQDIMIRPYQSPWKIYIIEEAEKLGIEAQNAMLKTIEEPPSYGMIFLIASGADALLPTIRSRCVKLSFQPLPRDVIYAELLRRGLPEKQAAVGADFSQGSLGRALALSGDEDFAALREELYGLLSELPEKSLGWLLEQEPLLEKYKKEADSLLELLVVWYRDVLVWQQTGDPERLLTTDYRQAIARMGEAFPGEQIVRVLHKIEEIREKLEQNANYSLAMDCLLLAMGKN